MKKFTLFTSMLLLLCFSLYGCGGGGGGATTTGGTGGDAPTVTAFTMPAAASALSVPVTAFTASDSTGVTGYLITESSSSPAASAAGWTVSAPVSYTFTSAGNHTVYAWAKNAAGVVSAGKPATVTVTVQNGPAAKAVNGAVKDPLSGGAAMPGVVVKAYAAGGASPVATATTGSDGRFSLTGLSDGSGYRFVFSRTGYAELSYYGIIPSQGAETELEPVLLLTNAVQGQTATINGYLRNAADNRAIPYATLIFRTGIGATTGDAIPYSRTTDAEGYYSRTGFPAGSYTAQVLSSNGDTLGYFTIHCVPGVPIYNNSQNGVFSTGTGTESYRAVLSWGSTPQDLDFHLTGPLAPGDTTTTIGNDDTPRFHIDSTQTTYPYDSGVAYSSPTIPGSATDSFLDIDQANHGVDNGSETLTILTQRSGPYRFYVYNNSSTGTLSGSGAVVRLYKGATLLRSYPVPAQSGNTWHVFDLDGSTITAVNTVSTVSADQTYNLARRIPGYPLQEELLFKPVLKRARVR